MRQRLIVELCWSTEEGNDWQEVVDIIREQLADWISLKVISAPTPDEEYEEA